MDESKVSIYQLNLNTFKTQPYKYVEGGEYLSNSTDVNIPYVSVEGGAPLEKETQRNLIFTYDLNGLSQESQKKCV